MKKHIITISGLPGSGKSYTGRVLAAELSYEHLSSGDLMREIGLRRGLSIEETNKVAEQDPTFDAEVDEMLRRAGEKENIIIDSRLAYHWIPESFKVFLTIDSKEAARRTFEQIKKEGRVAQTAISVEEVEHNMLERIASERKRYRTLYNIDYSDLSQYDLVVDSGLHEFDNRVQIIKKEYEKWLAQ